MSETKHTAPLYQVLAQKIAWEPPAGIYKQQRAEEIDKLCKEYLPSGSGWDCGTEIDLDESDGNRLVLSGEFHHMDENGSYDRWTSHQIIVTPDLQHGFKLKITGPNRNDIKEYLYELFDVCLREEVPVWPLSAERYKQIRDDAVVIVDKRAGV